MQLALCAQTPILSATQAEDVSRYHSKIVFVDMTSALIQSWITDNDSVHSLESDLLLLAETPAVQISDICTRSASEKAITMIDFCKAQRGEAPTWFALVGMIDALAGSDPESIHTLAETTMRAADACIDCIETMMQDSIHRLAEYAVAAASADPALSAALDPEHGWPALVEQKFLSPLAAEWRRGVREAVRRAEWLGGGPDALHAWRRCCVAFGWLHRPHTLLSDWFRFYSARFAAVDNASELEIQPCLRFEWMDPFQIGAFSLSVRSMLFIISGSERMRQVINSSLSSIGVYIAPRDRARVSHPWYRAGLFMFAESCD